MRQREVVPTQPGLYFVGLTFLYALSSSMVHGVGCDADYIAKLITARQADNQPGRTYSANRETH
ncbi:MAG: hypothetical protein ACRDSP_11755 [Pseudonocardiaceae bacterium]